VLALVGWGGVVLYSPHMKADTEDLAKASPAREATASQFAVTMPQADVRLETRGIQPGNMDIATRLRLGGLS